MQDQTRKLTYGAMMTALFAVLLGISFYIPLIGTITLFFIPLPIILYRLRYDRAASALVMVAAMIISVLIGGIAALPLALLQAPFGFIIGDTIRTGKSKLYVFMAAGLTLLITSILQYVAAVLFFKINIIEEFTVFINETLQQTERMLELTGGMTDQARTVLDEMEILYNTIIPSMVITSAFFAAFLIISILFPIIRRLGHEVPRFQPLRDMKLPVIAVWYYLIVLLLPFVVEATPGTTTYLIYMNAMFVLRVLFFLQGIAFILFYFHEAKLPKWATILVMFFAIILNPVTILLGILDSGINLRAWIQRSRDK